MYSKKIEDVLIIKESSMKGVSSDDVKRRKEKYGSNTFVEKKKKNIISLFFSKFNDILIIILISSAIISLLIDGKNSLIESSIIMFVVIMNAILGTIEEVKAIKSLESLKSLIALNAKVLRDGKVVNLKATEIVVGDIIYLNSGDVVSADIRIIESNNLRVDESSLTGEALPVYKQNNPLNKDTSLHERTNMLYKSTLVTGGSGYGVVVEVGNKTEVGNIAKALDNNDDKKSPLEIRLNNVSKLIGIICIVICLIVFGLEYFTYKTPLLAFKSAISLAVAAIPEGLTSTVSIMLAFGIYEMSKNKAIVKKPSLTEALGSVNVLCTDKTGTLTEAKLKVDYLYSNYYINFNDIKDKDRIFIDYFALATEDKKDQIDEAILELHEKYGNDLDDYKLIDINPFNSEKMYMTALYKYKDKYILFKKGAIDKLNIKISYIKENIANELAKKGVRVIGLCYKEFTSIDKVNESQMEFLGFCGLEDTIKKDAKEAIKSAKDANINVVMLTGDSLLTANKIAKELDILSDDKIAITGQELEKMSDEELMNKVEDIALYSRILPNDKLKVVNAWQKKGKIVGMTGDGVNDAPSLKKADIGIAMGSGTDISKDASDMIITDNSLKTITLAIKEGRGIYYRIKKCIHYLLSSNIGEVALIFFASFISIFLPIGIPLSPIHLLWINLITDILPAFSISMGKTPDKILFEKPKDKNENFFSNHLLLRLIVEGILIGILSLITYIIGLNKGREIAMTMCFLTLSLIELFHAIICNNDGYFFARESLKNIYMIIVFFIGLVLTLGVIFIPKVSYFFGFVKLDYRQLMISLLLSITFAVMLDTIKRLFHKA